MAFPADYLHHDGLSLPVSPSKSVDGDPSYGRVPLDTQASQHIAEFYNYDWFIVTAAVYRGFGRELLPEGITRFLNLPAPGRRQSLYIHLRVSRDLCF